jgi:hypothetical protein
MKKNQNYYWICAILCIGTQIHATPVYMDTSSPSFSRPVVCKPASENSTEPATDVGSLGRSASLEETPESSDTLGTPVDSSEPTTNSPLLSSEPENAPKEDSAALPSASSHVRETRQNPDSFTGIKTWLEGTALPVLQTAKDYTTDNLIPQAQKITENVAQQAKETGKTIVEYMNTNFVPKLKDLASAVGQTLISWATKSETQGTKAEAEDAPSELRASPETPII